MRKRRLLVTNLRFSHAVSASVNFQRAHSRVKNNRRHAKKSLDTYLSRRLTMLKRSLSLKWNFLPLYTRAQPQRSCSQSTEILMLHRYYIERNTNSDFWPADLVSIGQRLKAAKYYETMIGNRSLLFGAIEIIHSRLRRKKISIQWHKNICTLTTKTAVDMDKILFMLDNQNMRDTCNIIKLIIIKTVIICWK